jgi:hypothetical protein
MNPAASSARSALAIIVGAHRRANRNRQSDTSLTETLSQLLVASRATRARTSSDPAITTESQAVNAMGIMDG